MITTCRRKLCKKLLEQHPEDTACEPVGGWAVYEFLPYLFWMRMGLECWDQAPSSLFVMKLGLPAPWKISKGTQATTSLEIVLNSHRVFNLELVRMMEGWLNGLPLVNWRLMMAIQACRGIPIAVLSTSLSRTSEGPGQGCQWKILH